MLSGRRPSALGPGFTLVELLVVISIIALLLAVLLPALAEARNAAKGVRCGAQLREIGFAVARYLDDHNDALPTAEKADRGPDSANWWQHEAFLATLELEPLPQGRSVLTCPSDPRPDWYNNRSSKPCWSSYAANASCFGMRRGGSKRGRLISQVMKPAEALAFCDGQFNEGEPLVVGHQGCVVQAFAYRHRERASGVFLDGHVESIRPEDVPQDEDAWWDPFWGNLPQFW